MAKKPPTLVKVIASKPSGSTAAPTMYAPGSFWDAPPIDLGKPVKLQDTSQYTNALIDMFKPKNQIPAVNYGGINKAASGYANRDIMETINAYHAEQARLLGQGAQQAGLINRAAGAAAKATEPYADLIQNAYRAAAGDVSSFAQGASGDLQSAAQSDAAKLQAQLAGLGSSQVAETGQGAALGQTTQALGGLLPSGTLSTQGANAYASALAVPAAFRGYGQQTGIGVLGAAKGKADEYNLDINKVLATRGKLTSDYTTTLAQQAEARQKAQLDARNQQVEMLGKLATITDNSNRTQLAVQAARINVNKLAQSAVTLHNNTVRAQNTFNQKQASIMESWRHNRISEEQKDTQIANAATVANNKILQWQSDHDLAVTRAQTGIRQARTQQENSRGYYFLTDSKGNEVGLPQPTQNHKIVWASGTPGQGSFRSVLVHPVSAATKNKTKAARAKAISAAQKAATELVGGKFPDGQTDRRGRDYIPGWDPTGGPDGTGGFSDADPETGLGGGQLFLANKGKAPMGYQDVLRTLYHQTGDVLTMAQLKSIIDPMFQSPRIAEAHNLTASQASKPEIIARYTGEHQWLGTNPPKPSKPDPAAKATGSPWHDWSSAWQQSGIVRPVADWLAGRNPSSVVEGGSQPNALSDWDKAWQSSGVVRPLFDYLRRDQLPG